MAGCGFPASESHRVVSVTSGSALLLTPYGLRLGHATDAAGCTGCTVLLGDEGPFRAACHVLGRATGTRELHVLDPGHLVDRVDAILLTGGSAYGLDAAAGVMTWLEERGRGFPVGGGLVPIVPAAVIFDLAPLGRFDARPTPAMARAAAESATRTVTEFGSVGAGTGATVGKALGPGHAMKGGFGAAESVGTAARAVAMVVVNAFGDVCTSDGRILAGARSPSGGFADTEKLLREGSVEREAGNAVGRNTTLAIVAVDRALPRGELQQLARAASGAFHRRIRPAGSLLDGDVVFAVSPLPAAGDPEARPMPGDLLSLAALCTRALEAALERAVREAGGLDDTPGLADSGHSGVHSGP